MNETMKLMQYLNNAEKRAVRADRILTHAFYTRPSSDKDTEYLLLTTRSSIMDLLPLESFEKARAVARKIEQLCLNKWMDESKQFRNR